MHFGYVSNGIENLADELSKPFTRISVRCMKYEQPMSAILWRQDGTGLEIASEVHEVAEKCEIGNLVFALKDVPMDIDPFFTVTDLPSPLSAAKGLKTVKLTIFESGSSADGGLILSDDAGKSIAILAAAYPYCIATKGFSPELDKFVPEYRLEEYQQEIISS